MSAGMFLRLRKSAKSAIIGLVTLQGSAVPLARLTAKPAGSSRSMAILPKAVPVLGLLPFCLSLTPLSTEQFALKMLICLSVSL